MFPEGDLYRFEMQRILREVEENTEAFLREGEPPVLGGGIGITGNIGIQASQNPSPSPRARISMTKDMVFLIRHIKGKCAVKFNIHYYSDRVDNPDAPTMEDVEENVRDAIMDILDEDKFFYAPYGENLPAVYFVNTKHIVEIIPYAEEDYKQMHQRNEFKVPTSPRLSI